MQTVKAYVDGNVLSLWGTYEQLSAKGAAQMAEHIYVLVDNDHV
jgi:hypothetical protein